MFRVCVLYFVKYIFSFLIFFYYIFAENLTFKYNVDEIFFYKNFVEVEKYQSFNEINNFNLSIFFFRYFFEKKVSEIYGLHLNFSNIFTYNISINSIIQMQEMFFLVNFKLIDNIGYHLNIDHIEYSNDYCNICDIDFFYNNSLFKYNFNVFYDFKKQKVIIYNQNFSIKNYDLNLLNLYYNFFNYNGVLTFYESVCFSKQPSIYYVFFDYNDFKIISYFSFGAEFFKTLKQNIFPYSLDVDILYKTSKLTFGYEAYLNNNYYVFSANIDNDVFNVFFKLYYISLQDFYLSFNEKFFLLFFSKIKDLFFLQVKEMQLKNFENVSNPIFHRLYCYSLNFGISHNYFNKSQHYKVVLSIIEFHFLENSNGKYEKFYTFPQKLFNFNFFDLFYLEIENSNHFFLVLPIISIFNIKNSISMDFDISSLNNLNINFEYKFCDFSKLYEDLKSYINSNHHKYNEYYEIIYDKIKLTKFSGIRYSVFFKNFDIDIIYSIFNKKKDINLQFKFDNEYLYQLNFIIGSINAISFVFLFDDNVINFYFCSKELVCFVNYLWKNSKYDLLVKLFFNFPKDYNDFFCNFYIELEFECLVFYISIYKLHNNFKNELTSHKLNREENVSFNFYFYFLPNFKIIQKRKKDFVKFSNSAQSNFQNLMNSVKNA